MWSLSDCQMRRRKVVALYELEALCVAEEGWPSEDFVYDAERELYRFPHGSSPSQSSTQTRDSCGSRATSDSP